MADLTTGANAEGYEAFCDDIYNWLKNNWRQADPCSLAGLIAGMIVSDSADDKLYHAILASGCDCSEIVQTCVPVSDDEYVEWGDNFSGLIGYNTDNEALMLGVPVDPNLGLIICDRADIIADMTGFLTPSSFPMLTIVDLDLDSFIALNHSADDKPQILVNNDLGIMGGNVGVGIATPLYNLHVANDGSDHCIVGIDVSAGTGKQAQLYFLADRPAVGNTVGDFRFYNDGVTPVAQCLARRGTTDLKGQFQFATSNVVRIHIDEDGNIGFGTETFGTNAVTVLAMLNGTAPTTSPVDEFQMWSADVGGIGGLAGPHWRSEDGGMYAWHGGAGTIGNFTYQADIADNGTFNLPAITDSAWGFIQAGNNEEYALFTVDDDGDVTLISNSANVVANADTAGKICIGTAATQEPLTIRNRLGATKNINLIIWYSPS